MKLQELAVKPVLITVTIDDEDIIEQYGEPLEFYVWDRQPVEKFMMFAGKKLEAEDLPMMLDFCREMILDDKGKPVLTNEKVLPTQVMTKCVTKVMEQLGK